MAYFNTRYPKYVDIKFNNAICTTLIGVYYLLFQFKYNKSIRVFCLVLGLLVTLIGALTLLEYIFNVNIGIDQLFATDTYGIAYRDSSPGRMRAQSAIVFLFFGLALSGFSTKNATAHILSQYCLHVVSLIVAILLIGFIYNNAFLYNLRTYGFNFLYEGSLIFVMSIAASFLHPTLGLTHLFSGNMVGNKMARRLFALITMMILVFAAVKANYLGFKIWKFDTSFSLFIMCILLVALLIIWHTANWLNRIDLKRYEAEQKIKALNDELEQKVEARTADLSDLLEKYRESELKFRTLAEKSMVGIYISQKDKFIYVNPCFAAIFGYEPYELTNTEASPVDILISKEDRAMVREKIQKRYEGESENARYQARGRRKDGTYNYIEFFGSRVVINGAVGIIGTMLDITESKTAEEELRLSELKYKLLFEANPQPLWMIAKDDLSIISVNEAATSLYGYTKEELLNKDITIFRPKEDLPQQSEIFWRDLSSSTDLGVMRHLRKDGSTMFVHLVSHDIIFEGRKVRLSLTTDVTEKLKAEDNLQKSEANLRAILETTGTAYALLDKELNMVAYNQVAVRFAALPSNNPGGRLPDFFPKERFSEFRNYVNDVLKGKNISYEVNYPQPDGAIFFYKVRMLPIKNNQHEIFGMLLEISDITDIKKYTNAIEEQNKKFREIAWLQSHIVRAPLARMMGIINLLKDNDLDIEEHREFLKYLSISADELDFIIKDITDKTHEVK